MAKIKESKDVVVGEGTVTEQKKIQLQNASFPEGIGQADVEMIATNHPHYPADTRFKVHKAQVKKLELKDWARMAMVALLCLSTIVSYSQVTFKNNTYSSLTLDSAVNTGTAIVKARIGGEGTATVIQANIVKKTGTVAGTVSLWGSVDGVNFEACRLKDATTALHTYTATDVASQTFIWRLSDVSYLHYQVRHVGSGTMLSTLGAVGVIR